MSGPYTARWPEGDELLTRIAVENMLALADRFASGDRAALLEAITACAMYAIPMPEWVRDGWLDTVASPASNFLVASWDELFPPIKPPGRKLSALRMASKWAPAVVQAVHKANEAGRAIDARLFNDLARVCRWPFSGAQAKKLYYAAKEKPDAASAVFFETRDADPSRRQRIKATSKIRRKT